MRGKGKNSSDLFHNYFLTFRFIFQGKVSQRNIEKALCHSILLPVVTLTSKKQKEARNAYILMQ